MDAYENCALVPYHSQRQLIHPLVSNVRKRNSNASPLADTLVTCLLVIAASGPPLFVVEDIFSVAYSHCPYQHHPTFRKAPFGVLAVTGAAVVALWDLSFPQVFVVRFV